MESGAHLRRRDGREVAIGVGVSIHRAWQGVGRMILFLPLDVDLATGIDDVVDDIQRWACLISSAGVASFFVCLIFGVDVRNRTHSGSGWPSWIKDGVRSKGEERVERVRHQLYSTEESVRYHCLK